MRILLSGGGSGGHVFPLVALARALVKTPLPQQEQMEVYFVGPAHFSLAALTAEKIKLFKIPAGKARRYFSPLNILSPFINFGGFIKALWLMWRIMPDVVFLKGGYGSLAVGLVAWLYRIPIFIHESDAVPGLANRMLTIFATRVAVAFPEAGTAFPKNKTALVGIPIRDGVLNPPQAWPAFQTPRPTLLILGGSQGAVKINAVLAQILNQLLTRRNVIHVCGPKNFTGYKDELKRVYKLDIETTPGYKLFGELNEDDLGAALKAADLVISRAGASSIYEIASQGRPAILIPIHDSAQDHQSRNAFDYERVGAAVVIEETNLTPQLLLNEINGLMADEQKRRNMVQAAQSFARPDAAKDLSAEIVKLVTNRVFGLQSKGVAA